MDMQGRNYYRALCDNENGQINSQKGTAIDIKKQKDALEKSESRYHSLFEDAPIALWEVDGTSWMSYIDQLKKIGVHDFVAYFSSHADDFIKAMKQLTVMDVNNACIRLYHAPDKEILKKTALKLFKIRFHPTYGVIIGQILSGIRFLEMETTLHSPWRSENIVGNVSFSISPDFRILIGIVDMTERKRMENEMMNTLNQLHEAKDMLVQSEKLAAVGRLSAGVAHEVLNPLNIISINLQMMEKTEVLSAVAKDSIAVCKEQIERIVKINRDLCQFSRISVKEMTPGNVNNIISHVLDLVGPHLRVEEVVAELSLQKDLPSISLDRSRMEQVLLNIIFNALSAMKGRVEKHLKIKTQLSLSERGDDVIVIEIEDTGTGLKKEDSRKIFEPFFTTKSPGSGTGLGLSVSYGIIADHGGTIRADNNTRGGASFFIELPVSVIPTSKGELLYENDSYCR